MIKPSQNRTLSFIFQWFNNVVKFHFIHWTNIYQVDSNADQFLECIMFKILSTKSVNVSRACYVSDESNVYTLGTIGSHKVVSVKLPKMGSTRTATIAAENTVTRLLGKLSVKYYNQSQRQINIEYVMFS
jgi:hypothetical protein